MKMVIGGAYQGKTAYASETFEIKEENWIDGRTCTKDAVFSASAVHHFHDYIRIQLENDRLPDNFAALLIEKNPDLILVTNELGYGIVPLDPFERKYRETHGRICGDLAAYSAEVHRVVCGIGTVIKR